MNLAFLSPRLRSVSRRRVRATLAACAAVACFAPSPVWALIVADDANDVCSPSANPCVITDTVEVVDGSILDFGTRTLEVRDPGTLVVGANVATVRCGRFVLEKSGTAVDLNGTSQFGGSAGGVLLVEVRRRCSGSSAILCFSDAQCAAQSAGTCTSGDGGARLNGRIIGSADSTGALMLRAAGNVDVLANLTLDGASIEADGGTIEIESGGTIAVTSTVSVRSGGQSTGGQITLYAGVDVIASGVLDAAGGDFDGGLVELIADRDVVVTNDIEASSVSGGGYGGEITFDAGRDVKVIGGTSSNRTQLSTDGHQSIDLFGGDGGIQDFTAGRDIHIGPFARVTCDGAAPDGFGDFVSVIANNDVLVDGVIEADARGTQGGGGEISIESFGRVEIGATATLDVSGGQSGAGAISLFPDGTLVVNGTLDATAPSSGTAGTVDLDSFADVQIRGTISVSGGFFRSPGVIGVSGCRIDVLGGGNVNNTADDGRNTFTARERITVHSGGAVRTDTGGGLNRVTYRTPAKPPVFVGVVTPSPVLVLDDQLIGCPVCGNGELDDGETCEDGNRVNGDGCNSDCHDEGCVAGTPGYPDVALCDDGDPCTVDACDTQAHACTHIASCDDGIDCTLDTCEGDTCAHTPVDSACESPTPCAVGSCNAVSGCVFAPVPGLCDDGNFCNGSDQCGDGTCSVHSGDPCTGQPQCRDSCDEVGDRCASPVGTPCAPDANPCTSDYCNGVGNCIHPDHNEQCDDGVFCNGVDYCFGGTCGIHGGNPCDSAGECRDLCDEAGDTCRSEPGKACSDDGNICTVDMCDGSGECAHDPQAAFTSVIASVLRKGGPDNDRFSLKASFPIAELTAAPSSSGLRFEIVDPNGDPLYTVTLPASQISDVKGNGTLYRFRDKTGTTAGAPGIILTQLKSVPARGFVYVKMKGRNYELPAIVGKPHVSASLLFGSTPGADPCFGAALPCRARGSKVSCGE